MKIPVEIGEFMNTEWWKKIKGDEIIITDYISTHNVIILYK